MTNYLRVFITLLFMEEALAIKIKKIRELKGYSQDYVANKLAISQRAYSKIESGETRLHWDRMT